MTVGAINMKTQLGFVTFFFIFLECWYWFMSQIVPQVMPYLHYPWIYGYSVIGLLWALSLWILSALHSRSLKKRRLSLVKRK